MKRWLQSVTPDRSTLEHHWCLKHFTAVMLDRRCWTFNRSTVSRSFALGLFIAFIPPTPLPVHLTMCALLGVYLRLNLPVLVATVFVSNPFTWVPQVAGSLWVGAKLLGLDLMPVLHAISHRTLRTDTRVLWTDMGVLWPPLLLGALVLGLIAAASGYVLAQVAWRARVIYQLRQRRARLGGRAIVLD
ncbi:MAG TPA: DUF2062 domain-containing protein [Steroidobacteraceae bacterium]|jgi:hypothetical protein|nr:DUF2062 domain-containing protein [Steroidobacteraceae bacterium]